MASKILFSPAAKGKMIPPTNTVNNAGGQAYDLGAEHSLAQMAATGTFGKTFYVSGEIQLQQVLELARKVSPLYVAQVAVYARTKGFMKDMPAFLCAHLASLKTPEATELLRDIFPRVIDNGKMLRNFVQIVRSGVTGRKSFGQAVKKIILSWLEARRDDALFRDSVGESPSMADIVKMVHPKATRPQRDALYGYLLGHKGVKARSTEAGTKGTYVSDDLPPIVREYEAYKISKSGPVPNVPFQFLTSLGLGESEWTNIAQNAGWHMTRMNLNTFQRHGVFNQSSMAKTVANKLRDPEAIQKSKVFPYQLLSAYMNTASVPTEVREGLQDALELAVANAPSLEGLKVVICPDVSGSMRNSVTGYRAGATSAVRCVDVAGLMAAVFLRQNRLSKVIPFEQDVVLKDRQGQPLSLNPRDSVMTNAQKLAAIGGGGTSVSAPLAYLNREAAEVDLLIIVSDNESWMDSNLSDRAIPGWGYQNRGTETMKQWELIKQRNPKAKMVCLDITPNDHTQALERDDILNVGGFSDTVFSIIASFAKGELGAAHWVGEIKAIDVKTPRPVATPTEETVEE